MRGWGFTKKLEPIVWLSGLLGRGSLWAPNLIGALPRRREGKEKEAAQAVQNRDEGRGKRESSRSPPSSPEDETCKDALPVQVAALPCPPLTSASPPAARNPHPLGPQSPANLLAATAGTPVPAHLQLPVNHSEAFPRQLFCPSQALYSRPRKAIRLSSSMELLQLPSCHPSVPWMNWRTSVTAFSQPSERANITLLETARLTAQAPSFSTRPQGCLSMQPILVCLSVN